MSTDPTQKKEIEEIVTLLICRKCKASLQIFQWQRSSRHFKKVRVEGLATRQEWKFEMHCFDLVKAFDS